MISPWLLTILRCPACLIAGESVARALLTPDGMTLRCPTCNARYPLREGYVDMRIAAPPNGKTTVYADTEIDLDDPAVRPPLLSAGVRQWVLRLLLRPKQSDCLLDIGCGNGKFVVWNRGAAAHIVGMDAAARFAERARATVDLVQADARALPFASGAFTGAYSLDLVEHLDLAGVRTHLAETRRALTDQGRYFCFSNTRERSWLNRLIDPGRRLAERLHRAGLVDRTREHLRKGDHVKVLATTDDLHREFARAGLGIDRVWYLNPLIATYVETLALAVVEQRAGKGKSSSRPEGTRSRQSSVGSSPSVQSSVRDGAVGNPLLRAALRGATALLTADVTLFRAIRTGPYFLRARPRADR